MIGTPGHPPLEPATRRHLPVLDGVRGIAILMVMFHHFATGYYPETAPETWFLRFTHSMWMGVDVFFVLSGFLITGILLKAKGRPSYFKNFYMRRTLRIFPLYYGTLFIYFIILPILLGIDFRQEPGDAWWHLFYLSNFKQAFDGFQPRPLDIFWSLSIEEQYYAIWPLIVFLLPRKSLIFLCIAILISVPLIRGMFFWGEGRAVFIYLNTLTRIDAIVAGSLLAIIAQGNIHRLTPYRTIAKAAAIAGLISLLLTFSDSGGILFYTWRINGQMFGYTTIILVTVACFILLLTNPDNALPNRLITSRPLIELGKYSYAMYIYHVLVDLILVMIFSERYDLKGHFPRYLDSIFPMLLLYFLIATGLTLLLALLTWNLWEKHFLKLKDRFQ